MLHDVADQIPPTAPGASAESLRVSEARRRAAETLVSLSRVLVSTRDPATVSQRLVDCTRTIFGAKGVLLCRLHPRLRRLEVVAVSGDIGAGFGRSLTFGEWIGMPGLALRRRTPVTTCDILTDGRVELPAAFRVLIEAAPYRSVLSVPIIVDGRAMGTLCIMDGVGRLFTDDDSNLARSVADQAAFALENARLHEEARRRHQRAQRAAEVKRAALDAELVRQREELRALSRGILLAREEEARRIAHALHDDAGQLLASVDLALADIRARSAPDLHPRCDHLAALLKQTDEHLRRLSHELRPTILDDLGLGPALGWLAKRIASRIDLQVTAELGLTERYSSLIETALYRVVQEALSNVVRHAHATTAEIQLDVRDGMIHCVVSDDGVGFDACAVTNQTAHRGLGLIGMRERMQALGGTFALHTAPGGGTEVRVVVPRMIEETRAGLTG